MSREVSVAVKVEQLAGMLGTTDLSDWEDGFVQSVSEKVKASSGTTSLSDKQVEKIDAIYRKHFS